MIYSNQRKLILSGWLNENGASEYNSSLKLQKFLLFYEMFLKSHGMQADFSHLRGYRRGPVFSTVWGDYTHERASFDVAAKQEYLIGNDRVNTEYARRSWFLVHILSEKELSDLTHQFNLWKAKEPRIVNGEQQVELCENDFSKNDQELMYLLERMYPVSLIDDSSVIQINSHYFVFSKEDASKLTEQHFDALSLLSENEELRNPIYVEIDAEGKLNVD